MRSYFALQCRLLNRQFSDFGLHPLPGYLLSVILFTGFSAYLFYNVVYAAYVYGIMGLSITSLLSESGRVGFLKQHFSKTEFQKIRGLENILVVLPFIIGLLINHQWLIACGVLAVALLMSLSTVERNLNFTLPTPFYKYPFEFVIGFRKNYPVILGAGFVLTMAVMYDNANLGLFSLAVVLLLCLSYYMQAETSYLVWIYAMTPIHFLFHKVTIAMMYTALMSLPFIIVLLIFFTGHAGFIALLLGLGLLYQLATILGKYAFFPAPINLPQGILMAVSFWFPPLLLILIPYFYTRAIRQLKPILA